MIPYRFLLIVVFLSLSLPVANAEEASEGKPLSPEKTRIIYETLLPVEDDAANLAEPKDYAPERSPSSKTETDDFKMTAERMTKILRSRNIMLQGGPGHWQFLHGGMEVFLLIDSEHNRMRLVTPLARLDLLRQNPDFNEVQLLQNLLKANYLATGEVRLCLNNHVIWAVFLHPLDSLPERDLLGALEQLVEVARKTRKGGG